MKRALIVLMALALAACGQVRPGHVGIKVNQYGSGAGVEPVALGVGTYFTPFGTQIIEYPVFTQTYTYSKSATEGGNDNEEFTFQDKNGLNIESDIAVSYSVNAALAPKLYSKFRTDAAGLVSGQIRNAIRDSLNNRASALGVEEIYGPKKQLLLQTVQADVAAYFQPYGLNIEKLFYAGTIRMPDAVRDQINQRIANEQAALAAQANVATATANAQAKIEAAKGDSEANKLIADSIHANPEIVQLRAIEKWNGVLPVYSGGGGPLPFIGINK
ncbi:MAG TPA: SPFH domain-containing protein [Caulobacteraceae bacterium]|jgi:regulator of protease activity HflC (stomatin/prohibitin superfamily)